MESAPFAGRLDSEPSELGGLLLANETLDTILEHIASSAVRSVPSCDAAGVVLFEREQVVIAALSDPDLAGVEEHQYGQGDGPCLEALRSGELGVVSSLGSETRWPAFRRIAEAAGVVSCLAVPLFVGSGTFGALNLYARSRSFDELDEELARRYGGTASVAIANARDYAKAVELISGLQTALQTRDAIGQAKGIIRAIDGCDADTAFERLRLLSQKRNMKLREVAQLIVDDPQRALEARG